MPTSSMSEVLQHLQRMVLVLEETSRTDGQLLERYVRHRDEDALAALVRRHGPMVWDVCRRILRNHHEAEDAFQATFLVLVRKAESIASRERLASWLYGVAQRTAWKARGLMARRSARQMQLAEAPEPQVADPEPGNDLRPLLEQELLHLAEKYRTVLLLCDVEGKTRSEAAHQLGLPEGTVASRLARARTILARRLRQRGITLLAGAMSAILAAKAEPAAVPAELASVTLRSVKQFATCQGPTPARVAILARGVLQAMWMSKLKRVVLMLLVLSVSAVAGGMLWHHSATAQPEQAAADKHRGKDREKPSGIVVPAAPQREAEDDRIRPGDRLRIESANVLPPPAPQVDGVYRVEPKGTISLGVTYGRVNVKGQTLEEAEDVIREHLKRWVQSPGVAVTRYDPVTSDEQYSALERRVRQLEDEVRSLRATLGRGQQDRSR